MIQNCVRCAKVYDDATKLDTCPHREFEWKKVAKITRSEDAIPGWDDIVITYQVGTPALIALRTPYHASSRHWTAVDKWAEGVATPVLHMRCRQNFADATLYLARAHEAALEDRCHDLESLYRTCGWLRISRGIKPGNRFSAPTTLQWYVSFDHLQIGAHFDALIEDCWKLARDMAAAAELPPVPAELRERRRRIR